jgi:hypothetical protein
VSQVSKLDCEAARERRDDYSRGTLGDDEAAGVRNHLVGCGGCRTFFAEADPAVLFLRMRGTELPDRFWSGFTERLRARVHKGRFHWGDLFRYPKLAYLTAPVAMVLLLSASILLTGPEGLRFTSWPAREVIPSPYEDPELRGVTMAGIGIPARTAPPLLEEVGVPGARVYRFLVGEGSDETPIFLVVDESIDI